MGSTVADELEIVREKIRETDARMAQLFIKRMELMRDVADCKYRLGLPVFDEAQEKRVTERNSALVPAELRGYYQIFLQAAMEAAKAYQHDLIAAKKEKNR